MTADVPFWDIRQDAKDIEFAGLVAIEDELQRQHAARMGVPARFLGYTAHPEMWPKPYREALRLEAVSWLVLHGGA